MQPNQRDLTASGQNDSNPKLLSIQYQAWLGTHPVGNAGRCETRRVRTQASLHCRVWNPAAPTPSGARHCLERGSWLKRVESQANHGADTLSHATNGGDGHGAAPVGIRRVLVPLRQCHGQSRHHAAKAEPQQTRRGDELERTAAALSGRS